MPKDTENIQLQKEGHAGSLLLPSELLIVNVFSGAYYPTWMADDAELSPKNGYGWFG
ncbi:hypothetical protein ACJX0J_029720, partial [Zea mays]